MKKAEVADGGERILAVKTHAFGDALMATPAVMALLRAGNRVTALSGPSSHSVWSRLPGITDVVASPFPCSPGRLFAWSLTHRLGGFDRVIHFGSSSAVRKWLRFLTGISPEAHEFSKDSIPAALEFCRMAGVECGDIRPVFPVSFEEEKAVSGFTGSEPYAVIAPGGGRNPRDDVPEKRWPADRWNDVARFVENELELKVFFAGSHDDAAFIGDGAGTSLAGRLSWGETAALVYRAAVFAGNDSGPAHLAVAGNTPAIVLFGPTDPRRLYPPGTINAITSGSPCAPCYTSSVFRGCKGIGRCMDDITVPRVCDAIAKAVSP
jgi:ADP-heptose:LPS heptosyltransferase